MDHFKLQNFKLQNTYLAMSDITFVVTKRDGRTEKIDMEKIHRVIDWASRGL